MKNIYHCKSSTNVCWNLLDIKHIVVIVTPVCGQLKFGWESYPLPLMATVNDDVSLVITLTMTTMVP